MNNKLLQTIKDRIPAIILAMTVGILSACSNDTPEQGYNPDASNDINVSVKISAGPQNSTRGMRIEEYGTVAENKIDLAKLKILIFDNDDVLYDIWYTDNTAADDVTLNTIGLGEYILNAKLSETKYSPASKFSIVTISNWNPLGETEDVELNIGETTLNGLSSYIYGLNKDNPSESWVPEDDSLIPMFGVLYTSLKGYTTSIFSEKNPMELGTVNLLRSLVKIEVLNNSGNNAAEITSITINKRNTRGYMLPAMNKGVNTDQVTRPNVPSTGIMNPAGYTEEKLKFHQDGNLFVAYVPEFELGNTVESRNCIDVNISYKDDNPKYQDYDATKKIVLAPYDAITGPNVPAIGLPDEWKALLRNHIYRFVIKTINVDSDLDMAVDVVPYRSCVLEPSFGIDR